MYSCYPGHIKLTISLPNCNNTDDYYQLRISGISEGNEEIAVHPCKSEIFHTNNITFNRYLNVIVPSNNRKNILYSIVQLQNGTVKWSFQNRCLHTGLYKLILSTRSSNKMFKQFCFFMPTDRCTFVK